MEDQNRAPLLRAQAHLKEISPKIVKMAKTAETMRIPQTS